MQVDNMRIEELSDFPALQQLSNALWKVGSARGAAILIGAGFSRNAEKSHAQTPDPPLWPQLADELKARLYPGTDIQRDPLRLAEEFRASLGSSAIEAVIRDLIRDEEWFPGELHKALIRLPWTDILTTNWDTLLERAALENLGQTYETVRCIGDIATTRAPRIVKLHGSLPSNRPFIISEEDYRTYPRIFAPFVNLVQQTLLENELCLLGFSGDDPNFLQWSGWVRDQLGVSARRIYLVGALNLIPAQRRLLESRNICPIDLSPMVGSDPSISHREAATQFLSHLAASRPTPEWDWPQKRPHSPIFNPLEKDINISVRAARATILQWREERDKYPGWIVCPPAIRSNLKSATLSSLFPISNLLDNLTPTERGQAVFESLWRLEVALIPTFQSLLEAYEKVVHCDDCWIDPNMRSFVAICLLRNAREQRNQGSFHKLATFVGGLGSTSPELALSLQYERCLWTSNELNFTELKALIEGLNGTDPIWKLRKAGLLCELGNFREARQSASEGLRQIRERFYWNRNSVWVISRLAWARFLLGGLRRWDEFAVPEADLESEVLKLRFFETKSDPWEIIQQLEIGIEENLKKLQGQKRSKEPQFKAGSYRDHSSTIHFGSWWPTESIYEAQRICELAGIPSKADHVKIMCDRVERAEVLVDYKYQDEADYLRAIHIAQTQGNDFINRAFTRMRIASIPLPLCIKLIQMLRRALDCALDEDGRKERPIDSFWVERAAAYIEIISRLSVRLSVPESENLFQFAMKAGIDPKWQKRELIEPLSHFLENSFSTIPPQRTGELIAELLSFPIPCEVRIGPPWSLHWPDPSEWISQSLIRRPADSAKFAKRIEELIEITRNGEADSRDRASRRLASLYFAGALTAAESANFGDALWARRKSDADLPEDTHFYHHMFALLPSPDPELVHKLLLERAHGLTPSDELVSIAAGSQRYPNGNRRFRLPKDKALKLLRGVLKWTPKTVPQFDLGGVERENEESRRAIGQVLADAILPELNLDDLTGEQLIECYVLIESGRTSTGAQAIPELLALDKSHSARAMRDIQTAMFSTDNDNDKAWSGFNAIHRWIDLSRENRLDDLPEILIDRVLSAIETRREPGLLHALSTSLMLLRKKKLNTEHAKRLAEALPAVFAATDYSDQSTEVIDPITYTLVRAGAVRLAYGLKQEGIEGDGPGWNSDYENDPMPEVRFALVQDEE
jgi:hypothetical protein